MKQKGLTLISNQVSEATFELRNAVYHIASSKLYYYLETKASI